MANPTVSDVQATLEERGVRYGNFLEDASICQGLKERLHREPGWAKLMPDQKQALEMIMVKTARILNGDPDWEDHWHDIAGYATLVVNRLREERKLALPAPSNPPSSDELPKLLRNIEGQSTVSSGESQSQVTLS